MQTSQETKTTFSKPTPGWAALGLLILCGLAFAGYQSLYSSFAPYDDEGYVMISLQSYIGGAPLYDATYSQYGPAYFQLNSWLHRLLDLPITHDLVRWKTLAAWLLVALMAGIFVGRTSENRLAGLAAMPLVFFHLDRLGLEAAHPQELCLLLTFGCLMLTTMFNGQRTRSKFLIATIGVLVGLLLMVKLNLGVFLILSLSLAFVWFSPNSRSKPLLFLGAAGLSMLMPLVVMRKHLGTFEGLQLPLLILGSVAIATVCLQALRKRINSAKGISSVSSTVSSPATEKPTSQTQNRTGLGSLASVVLFACSILVVSSIIIAIAYWQGTSMSGLLHGLVLQHANLNVYSYVNFLWLPLPAILVSAFCAFMIVARNHELTQKWVDLGILALIGCLFLRQLTDSFIPVLHGGTDRSLGSILSAIVTPFAWIVLIPILDATKQLSNGTKFSRVALCSVAIIQPMQAFPIPGTQVGLGSVVLVMVILIALVDLLDRGLAFDTVPVETNKRRVLAIAVTACLVLIIARDYSSWNRRESFVSLDLPGAQRLRLSKEEVEQFHWVVEELKANGETFIAAANGYPSFYFWTELSPPTDLNATFWPTLLNRDQQLLVQSELENREYVCLLVNNKTKWQALNTPLAKYLSANFSPVHTRNQHEIWLRRRTDIETRGSQSPDKKISASKR